MCLITDSNQNTFFWNTWLQPSYKFSLRSLPLNYGPYILHYNPNLTPSIYLHEQVLSPNDGPFSSFWYLPSYLYRSYYPITHCLCGYKPILILKPWTLRLSLENTWDTKMNIPLCMLLKKQIRWFPTWGWSMHSPIKFAVLYHHNGA